MQQAKIITGQSRMSTGWCFMVCWNPHGTCRSLGTSCKSASRWGRSISPTACTPAETEVLFSGKFKFKRHTAPFWSVCKSVEAYIVLTWKEAFFKSQQLHMPDVRFSHYRETSPLLKWRTGCADFIVCVCVCVKPHKLVPLYTSES